MCRSGAPYRVDPLERWRNTIEDLAQLVLRQTSHYSLRWDDHLVESQEGLKTEIGLRADLVECSCYETKRSYGVLASDDYEMLKLVSNDLVIGSGFCPWSLTFAWHDFQIRKSMKVHTHMDSLSVHTHAFKCHVFQITWDERWCSKLLRYFAQSSRMLRHAHRWIYHEGLLIGGSGRTASSPSCSLREVVLERVSILVVDLFYGESVEGPATQEAEFEVGIKEDPSEPEIDPKIEAEGRGTG
ncbi:hypothetical protein M9H77_18514 [Catharanthus roseus]|uniref:Uncharacterized protein n=1 Tax=Catharanthus roseus TaxID=4058 RepID=A0ACC0B7N8_CATRO|nr:hypothetical protein M9H77_18514 [Catharanthus roseus]